MESGTGNFEPGKKYPQYLAALSVCLGSVATGTVLGWTANISEEMKKGDFNDIVVDEGQLGWIGSFANLGAMVMCFPIGLICDKIGRKYAMLSLIVPFLIGWLIIIFSTGIEMIYAGRFITGMAGGAFCISAPLYTSEIAQKEVRGALGSYFQLLLTVGILFAYLMAYVTTPLTYTIICSVIPLVFGVVFFFQPETPVYLLKTGKDVEARDSLLRLRGNKYDVDTEMREIKAILEEEKRTVVKFTDAIKKPAAKRAAVIAFGLMLFQQLSGINAVIFYTSDIFESSGSDLDAKIATIIVGVMQVIATFISSLVIDKLGRKILLLGSDLIMTISGCMLGAYFTLKDRDLVDTETIKALGFLPVLSLCIFVVVFSLGYGPIPWLISAEVFPPEVKTVASSAAGTFNWFLAFLVTKFYLDLKIAVGGDVTFYIFSGISLLGTLYVVTMVPETKGKTLDEIQRELSGEKVQVAGIENKGFSH